MKSLPAVLILTTALFGTAAYSQNTTESQTQATKIKKNKKHGRSAAGDVGSGVGDYGKGAAGAAGHAAAGAGKGAADLATLHPVGAAGNVGKGAAYAGKDAGVGAAKGTGKVVKGVGKGLKHIF